MPTYLIYKPYLMHSQFSRELPAHTTLADLDFEFPKDVYPIGRLDADSEGLLLLSNDKSLNKKILDPLEKVPKTYWVQVEGIPDEASLQRLREGVMISVKGKKHITAPAVLSLLSEAPDLPERQPPIRFRKNVPDAWLSISITEGKNRQVRKMLAAIGFPVLRLVRAQLLHFQLGAGSLQKMQAGEILQVNVKL